MVFGRALSKGELHCGVHDVSRADARDYYDLFVREGVEAARAVFPRFAEGLKAECWTCQLLHTGAVDAVFPIG
ncbi:MAG: hypothetical protein A2700_02475 [Candidatus Blackburnbacteria bacterium RIFCSPHIGHO2_01_FULL_44_64]|uniref:Uncharacterized protein n=1 Tax=Candidatus Blackburnbacteria bacterium RIFCSPHIGHO2_02_FULL_44_20 TaxID=1797516 RepID=A0A1G1V7L5_9BACT|nr:MAG: hypothetical protein A2700_02475 [Candidatus Blackburnbacteria bacterium RIFCSPHIGHO2_01_FULL_44_64]OGY11317.1 MAG: hypothetical protein A3D26_02320 [Candidatus Blackburnbacteria bacterium RIFCSPHIGHO2_02_FULL_44_20]OGY11456.1 MAG: hypothetical protein A3E16_02225 [Candidatus Blackburnbacteria bacterium RIFCSPHIGHO2_12_FULL_44_25]OGY14379.1 MAG: hypothetical protein A3A62_01795 [Candidatus Blackburnbacteria bacterium RIFCSPLOWO2_01_FULL_44_43]OGY17358.1 MAG: hypothetical protein A3H88_0